MKQIVVYALLAALVCGIAFVLFGVDTADDSAFEPAERPAEPSGSASDGRRETSGSPRLTVTDALPEDVWVDGSRQSGDDHRILTSAATSVCFITKIEIRGIGSPQDSSGCTMQVDDFTGFWDLVVSVPEGSQAHIRCNARCLTWE